MKIRSVKIHNINSLKGTHHIDLETGRLAQFGIFGITGAIGSGKSTILDCICLALYDMTPRIKNASAVNVKEYLSRTAAEGWTEVEFEAEEMKRYIAG